jgi:streptogramin lyase
MSLSVTGGGIYSPTALGIDTLGNVWVADDEQFVTYTGGVSAFSPQGTPYSSGYGFGSSVLNEVFGLTVDQDNDVWATSEETVHHGTTAGSVAVLFGATSGQTLGSLAVNLVNPAFDFPESMATDTNKTVMIGNYANGTATVYNDGSYPVSTNLGSGYATLPTAITADGNHGVWFANNGSTTVTHVDQNNTLLATTDCCNGPNGIARDSAGNVWVSNYYGQVLGDGTITPGSFSELNDAGAVLINQQTGGGLMHPAGVSLDAGQNVWVASYYANAITEISGYTSATPGTFLSPSTGFGLDAQLVEPFAVTPDASGNIWVSCFGNNKLVMFFGLGTPTATPAGPAPLAP